MGIGSRFIAPNGLAAQTQSGFSFRSHWDECACSVYQGCADEVERFLRRRPRLGGRSCSLLPSTCPWILGAGFVLGGGDHIHKQLFLYVVGVGHCEELRDRHIQRHFITAPWISWAGQYFNNGSRNGNIATCVVVVEVRDDPIIRVLACTG